MVDERLTDCSGSAPYCRERASGFSSRQGTRLTGNTPRLARDQPSRRKHSGRYRQPLDRGWGKAKEMDDIQAGDGGSPRRNGHACGRQYLCSAICATRSKAPRSTIAAHASESVARGQDSRPATRDLDISRLQCTSVRLPHPNRAGKLLNRLAPKGVYSFCITLMCCCRTAVAGSRNLSARSASSR